MLQGLVVTVAVVVVAFGVVRVAQELADRRQRAALEGAGAVATVVAAEEPRCEEPWPEYPGAVPAGWQTMSAVGGGGGSIQVMATTDPPDEVAAWLRQRLGAPDDDGTSWTRRYRRAGWRGGSSVTVHDAAGAPPPGVHEPPPEGTRTFIVYDAINVPG